MKLIGRREYIDLPLLGIEHIEAKIDTGAYTCAIHCDHISIIKTGDKEVLRFKLLDPSHPEYNNKEYQFDTFTTKKIKNSFGEMEERFIVKTLIRIGRKKINTTISLSDRANMRYPVLIGRRLLKGKFIIDVSQVHTNGVKVKKGIKK